MSNTDLIDHPIDFYNQLELIPYSENIKITTTYKGEKIDQEYFETHPEIKQFLPGMDAFRIAYHRALSKVQPDKILWIHVSENGIRVEQLEMEHVK
ncbi:MAG TPA: hypothetical protein VK718_05430 [Ferruginibacter sp.]|nr:hypothetical protein [Ferruginibacter sp.]